LSRRKKERTFEVEVYIIKGNRRKRVGNISITRSGAFACALGSKAAVKAAHALFNLPHTPHKKQKIRN